MTNNNAFVLIESFKIFSYLVLIVLFFLMQSLGK